MQANRNCRNPNCRSSLPIDQELVCSSCWDVICQDARFAMIYQSYRNNVEHLRNNQQLSPEERTEEIELQRYHAEAEFLVALDVQPVPPRLNHNVQTTGETSQQR